MHGVEVDFEDLAQVFKGCITQRAARVFAGRVLGSFEMVTFNQQDEGLLRLTACIRHPVAGGIFGQENGQNTYISYTPFPLSPDKSWLLSHKNYWPNGGVSQQPDSLMLPGQFRECDNFTKPNLWSSNGPGLSLSGTLLHPTATVVGSLSVSLTKQALVQISKTGDVKIWDSNSGISEV